MMRHMSSSSREERRGSSASRILNGAVRRLSQQAAAFMESYRELATTALSSDSAFIGWTKDALSELLADYGVEVVGGCYLRHQDYVKLATEIFKDMPIPKMPKPKTKMEMAQRHEAAKIIQRVWFKSRIRVAPHRMGRNDKRDSFLRMTDVGKCVIESPRFDGSSPPTKEHKFQAKTKKNSMSNEEWSKPSVEAALAYQAKFHPRQTDGSKYPLCSTSTGRYCFIGGCGEQMDLFEEGMFSDFVAYGSGISNYFKLIKWAGWMCFGMSLVMLPALVINITSNNFATWSSSIQALGITTLGSLGDYSTSQELFMPFCNPSNSYHVEVCDLGREMVHTFLVYTDIVLLFIVIIGYFWINKFVAIEADLVDKSTVTAQDFTAYIPRIPRDTTEIELRAHFAKVTESPVAEISIGRDQRYEIDLYKRIGITYRKREYISQQIKFIKATGRNMRKVSRLMNEKHKLQAELLKMMKIARVYEAHARGICAYVTFETEDGLRCAMREYKGSWWRYLFMPKNLRFKKHRLTVRTAPQPSTILWENIGFSRISRLGRICVTTSLANIMLLISIVIGFAAAEARYRAAKIGGTLECPSSYYSMTEDEQQDFVNENEDYLHCYCSEKSWTDSTDETCFDYLVQLAISNVLSIGASLVTVIINVLFNTIVNKMGRYEKHRSLDDLEDSIFTRLFILKFINLGFLFLLVSSPSIVRMLSLSFESEPQLSSAWYQDVGTNLLFTMMLTIFTPHMTIVALYALHKFNWHQKRDVQVTQGDLNRLSRGADFLISLRLAEIISIFFICFIYSAGMPLLLVIGTVSFFTYYWVEKYMFINFYLTPPQYNEKLITKAVNLIPYAILLHAVFTIFVLWNGRIFYSEASEENEIAADNGILILGTSSFIATLTRGKTDGASSLISLFVALIIAALVIIRDFKDKVVPVLVCLHKTLTCSSGPDIEHSDNAENTVSVSYSDAVIRGVMKGLHSYNILQNPVYKEAFSISDSFAQRHNRVSSVQRLILDRQSSYIPAGYRTAALKEGVAPTHGECDELEDLDAINIEEETEPEKQKRHGKKFSVRLTSLFHDVVSKSLEESTTTKTVCNVERVESSAIASVTPAIDADAEQKSTALEETGSDHPEKDENKAANDDEDVKQEEEELLQIDSVQFMTEQAEHVEGSDEQSSINEQVVENPSSTSENVVAKPAAGLFGLLFSLSQPAEEKPKSDTESDSKLPISGIPVKDESLEQETELSRTEGENVLSKPDEHNLEEVESYDVTGGVSTEDISQLDGEKGTPEDKEDGPVSDAESSADQCNDNDPNNVPVAQDKLMPKSDNASGEDGIDGSLIEDDPHLDGQVESVITTDDVASTAKEAVKRTSVESTMSAVSTTSTVSNVGIFGFLTRSWSNASAVQSTSPKTTSKELPDNENDIPFSADEDDISEEKGDDPHGSTRNEEDNQVEKPDNQCLVTEEGEKDVAPESAEEKRDQKSEGVLRQEDSEDVEAPSPTLNQAPCSDQKSIEDSHEEVAAAVSEDEKVVEQTEIPQQSFLAAFFGTSFNSTSSTKNPSPTTAEKDGNQSVEGSRRSSQLKQDATDGDEHMPIDSSDINETEDDKNIPMTSKIEEKESMTQDEQELEVNMECADEQPTTFFSSFFWSPAPSPSKSDSSKSKAPNSSVQGEGDSAPESTVEMSKGNGPGEMCEDRQGITEDTAVATAAVAAAAEVTSPDSKDGDSVSPDAAESMEEKEVTDTNLEVRPNGNSEDA